MTLARDAAIACVSAGLGMLCGWLAVPPATEPAPSPPSLVPPPPPTRAPARADERRPPRRRPPAAPSCDEAIAAALMEAAERQERLATGEEPFPWPADLDPTYRHATVDAELTGIVGRSSFFGGVDLDCSEFPCIAYIDLPEHSIEDDSPYAMEQVRSMFTDLQEVWPDLVVRPHVGCSQHACSTTVYFTPTEHHNDMLENRIGVRRRAFEYGVDD